MQQYGLTEKQLKLFKFIKNYITKNKISPSYEEMKVAIGLKSKCSIQKKIEQLQDRGWLTKLHGKSRSIKILKWQTQIFLKNLITNV